MSLIYIGNFLGNQKGFYAGPNQWMVDSFQHAGYAVKYTSSKLNKFSRLWDIAQLIITERKKTKLAFIDTYSTQAFYFACFAAWLCSVLGLNYVLILHGGNLPSRFQKSANLVNWIFKNAFQIVAPSAYLQQMSVEAYLPKPIVIPNPIAIENYTFKQRKQLKPSLLWVRSLQSIYNPTMAILVVEKLKEKYPTINLTMVGPDKENILPSLKELVKSKSLERHIAFTGKLSLKEWTVLAEQHDIFINTTHIDNTPVSVLEAMALGLPVVSTNVGGIPYILDNNEDALLCNDNDIDAMASAIELLLTNANLTTKISHSARTKIEKNYSSSSILKQWIELINASLN